MKPVSNTVFYAVFLLIALSVAVVAIGMSLATLGIYEWVKDFFHLSYPRAAIVVGSVIWFATMIRFLLTGGMDALSHRQ